VRRAILISLGIVALVTGCGGGSSEPSASGEWTRHDIRDTNASVALPEEWKALEDFDEQTLSDFTDENEKFAPYVEPLLRNDVFKLFALDPDIEEAFATNLNVIVAPVGMPLRDWVARENASTRRVAVPGSLRTSYVTTPGGEAARVSWLLELNSGGEKKTVRSVQYMFQDAGSGYVLTFSTLPSLATKYEPTFKKSAESFRLG
jgi:hypothetical protein